MIKTIFLVIYLGINIGLAMIIPFYYEEYKTKIKNKGILLKHVLFVVFLLPAFIFCGLAFLIVTCVAKIYKMFLPLLNKKIM